MQASCRCVHRAFIATFLEKSIGSLHARNDLGDILSGNCTVLAQVRLQEWEKHTEERQKNHTGQSVDCKDTKQFTWIPWKSFKTSVMHAFGSMMCKAGTALKQPGCNSFDPLFPLLLQLVSYSNHANCKPKISPLFYLRKCCSMLLIFQALWYSQINAASSASKDCSKLAV